MVLGYFYLPKWNGLVLYLEPPVPLCRLAL